MFFIHETFMLFSGYNRAHIQDRNIASVYWSRPKAGDWIEVDLLLSCQVEAISFDFSKRKFTFFWMINIAYRKKTKKNYKARTNH